MNGIYGTIKPAYLTAGNIASDVEIYYSYRENRGADNATQFKQLSPASQYLVPATGDTPNGVEVLPGLFTLKLPLESFSETGIYTIYIKPTEIEAIIQDIGVLSAYPDVRGMVLKTFDGNNSVLNVNGALTGYRVEYFGLAGNTRSEDFTIITSSNKCSTIIQNIISTNQKAVRYRFDDTSNLIFCTVSPSTSPSFNAIHYLISEGLMRQSDWSTLSSSRFSLRLRWLSTTKKPSVSCLKVTRLGTSITVSLQLTTSTTKSSVSTSISPSRRPPVGTSMMLRWTVAIISTLHKTLTR